MRLLSWGKRTKIVGAIMAGFLSVGLVIAEPQAAYADFCSTNGLSCNVGYFQGRRYTGSGHNVISAPALLSAQGPARLISLIGGHLGCVGGHVNGGQNGTGAAFIVLTMLGQPPGSPRDRACVLYGEWVATVNYWAPYTNYNVVNYYFGGLNTRYADNDVQYFQSTRTSALSIVFYSPTTGQPMYAIKKDCANPVGVLRKLDRPKNYTLTPTVHEISPMEIESTARMTVSTRVNNPGEVNSPSTRWEITMMTVLPGRKAPGEDANGTVSGAAPCQSNGGGASGNYFQSGDSSCKNIDKGSRAFVRGTSTIIKDNIDIGDVPVGTRICFALSVQPRANTDTRWAHSKPKCTVVGKKPKIQIWGGDVAVRGNIETSTSTKTLSGTDKRFGSWVEYGAFSVGVNSRFASGSGLIDQTNNSQSAWSKLTFANKNAAGADMFGQYAPAGSFRPTPGVASFFNSLQNKQAVGSSTVNNLASLTSANNDPLVVRTASNLTINGGEIGAGRSVVIMASGTVTINGNIEYADETISSVNDIPQVVIIANNIRIKDTVTQIDAWLVAETADATVANGTIDTCYDSGILTSEKCADRLEVNGPVIAGRILLNRTAGSGTGAESGDPAERFNLRPDAHLWAHLQAQGSNKAQTVYSVELPPRF